MNPHRLRWISWIAAWNVTAALLFVRVLSLDIERPAWQAVLASLLFVAVSSIGRLLLVKDNALGWEDGWWTKSLLFRSFTPGAIIFALWLSQICPSIGGLIFIWLLTLAVEASWLVWDFGNRKPTPSINQASQSLGEPPTNDIHEGSPLGDEENQRLTRSVVDSVETLTGLVRVRYQEGQRIATAYVGFVPPILPNPQIEAEVVWGSEAALKVIAVHGQGAEIEVKRESTDDGEESTILEVYASPSS